MFLFTQSMQIGFALSITKLKENKKKNINFCDHRDRDIDIVTDTSSPAITEMDVKPISGRC